MTAGLSDTRPHLSCPAPRSAQAIRTGFDLCLSENPFAPLPSVLAAVHRTSAEANRYPEFLPTRLPRLIAQRIGVASEQVVVGAGATGVAMQAMQAVLQPGDRIVFAVPTFDGYPILAGIAGARSVGVPLDAAGRQDLRALAAAIDERTGMVVVCRPHNPTGTLVSEPALRRFLMSVPARVVVLLDEAYVEFLGPVDRVDVLALTRRFPNLLVVRTFSKAYGLAGLRVGYAFGAGPLIARLQRRQVPFGIGASAEAAVAASYAAETELRRRVTAIVLERDRLRDRLLQQGIDVPYSHANFLYLPGATIADRLRRAGITPKPYPDGSARIAVGDPAASRAVLAALR